MGMRATYAHISTSGRIKVTSVQWSTFFDANLTNALAAVPAEKRHETATKIFSEVTRHGHVSCVDNNTKGEPIEGTDLTISAAQPRRRHDSRVAPVSHRFDNVRDDYTDIFNYHLDGGSIGAIFDERRPDRVTFFWLDSVTGKIVHSFKKLDTMRKGGRARRFVAMNNADRRLYLLAHPQADVSLAA